MKRALLLLLPFLLSFPAHLAAHSKCANLLSTLTASDRVYELDRLQNDLWHEPLPSDPLAAGVEAKRREPFYRVLGRRDYLVHAGAARFIENHRAQIEAWITEFNSFARSLAKDDRHALNLKIRAFKHISDESPHLNAIFTVQYEHNDHLFGSVIAHINTGVGAGNTVVSIERVEILETHKYWSEALFDTNSDRSPIHQSAQLVEELEGLIDRFKSLSPERSPFKNYVRFSW